MAPRHRYRGAPSQGRRPGAWLFAGPNGPRPRPPGVPLPRESTRPGHHGKRRNHLRQRLPTPLRLGRGRHQDGRRDHNQPASSRPRFKQVTAGEAGPGAGFAGASSRTTADWSLPQSLPPEPRRLGGVVHDKWRAEHDRLGSEVLDLGAHLAKRGRWILPGRPVAPHQSRVK